MSGVVGRKSVETAILSSLLFYAFANPSTFKALKKFPGLKFVMKSAKEITHSGVVVNAVLFGVVLFFCVWLINSTMLKDYVNVVEGLTEHSTDDDYDDDVMSDSDEQDSLELEDMENMKYEGPEPPGPLGGMEDEPERGPEGGS